MQVRKNVNELDAQTSGKAVDALLNYETVCNRSCLSQRCFFRPAWLSRERDHSAGAQNGSSMQVTLFNNQAAEVSQYDTYLTQYQRAMNNIERLAATLNAGQAAILNVGIVSALVSAVAFTPGGTTPGDLILIQGMLLQLWAPLQFLGWFFRCACSFTSLVKTGCCVP